MKKIFTIALIVILCFNSNWGTYAMEVSAKSAVLINACTNEILYEKNSHEKMGMASTTKIMTAVCAVENGRLDDVVKISENAAGVEGSSMYLLEGEEFYLKDMLYGLMLNSGNDSAVAIAEHISGSVEKFVELMNKKAKQLGAYNTSFKNPNGLDADGHYTTAYDLALISAYAMRNPTIMEIVETKTKIVTTLKGEKKYLTNHNKLLKMYKGVRGVKTGYTKKSGRCLVGYAENADIKIIAVTLNAPNDWNDHTKMYDFGLNNFKSLDILEKNRKIDEIKVRNSKTKSLLIYPTEDFRKTVAVNEMENYRIVFDYQTEISAPVIKNQLLGKVKIYYKDELIKSVKILSDRNIEKNIEKKNFGEMFRLLCMLK